MRVTIVAFALILAIACAGCGTKDSGERFSPDKILSAEVDLELEGSQGPRDRMAEVVYPMDTRLRKLLQEVETFDPQGEVTAREAFSGFSWLGEVAVVSLEGEVQRLYPEGSSGGSGWEELTDPSGKWQDRRLHSLYPESSSGTVIVLRPIYTDGEMSQYLAVRFQFASLARTAPRSRELFALRPGRVLWPGKQKETSRRLAELKWDDFLEDRAFGRFRLEQRQYLWLARYIGRTPFFYAIEIS